jgi:hypothetical protein
MILDEKAEELRKKKEVQDAINVRPAMPVLLHARRCGSCYHGHL